jgi:uncharacterized protein YggE
MKNIMSLLFGLLLLLGPDFLFAQHSANSVGNAKVMEQRRYNDNNYTWFNQAQNNSYPSSTNEIVLKVDAIMNVKPDAYVACFNIIQIGKTVREVNNLMNNRIDSLITDLKKIGVEDENIFLDFISQVPVYELEEEKKIFSKKYNEVPVGFELQKNILVQFSDGKMLDKIITSAAFYEIYDLVKVESISLKHEELLTDLRNKAIKLMEEKVESYKNLEFNLDTLYKVFAENSNVVYPITQYKSYQSYSRPSYDALNKSFLSVDKKRSMAHVPTTMYYNQIPYNKFDIVIDPIILEPAIQYTYSVSVKYIIREPQPKKEKHFLLLTPQGDIKTIDIR